MSDDNPSVRIHVNIEVSVEILQSVVANSKKIAAANPSGGPFPDTADRLSSLISRFLKEKGFQHYVGDIANY